MTNIVFGYSFNKSVVNLQDSVTSIIFEGNFNKSVDNLPKSLTSITFGHDFDKSLKKLLKFVKTICFYRTKTGYIYNNIIVYITKFIHNGKTHNLNNEFSLKYYVAKSKIKKLPYGCTLL